MPSCLRKPGLYAQRFSRTVQRFTKPTCCQQRLREVVVAVRIGGEFGDACLLDCKCFIPLADVLQDGTEQLPAERMIRIILYEKVDGDLAGERVGAGLVACQQSLLTFQAGLFGAIDALQ